jgi:hypothetical protein
MTEVIVERSFEEPVEYGAIQDVEDRGRRCLEVRQVRFVRTWFSKDRRRMICLYEAPDAEAVRSAQRKVGLAFDRAWSCTFNPRPAGWPGPGPGFHEVIVVERAFAEPLTPAAVAALFEGGAACLPRHRVVYLGGYLATEGRRMICVFAAPDAESVRIANREGGAPFDRAWTATPHEPAPAT